MKTRNRKLYTTCREQTANEFWADRAHWQWAVSRQFARRLLIGR